MEPIQVLLAFGVDDALFIFMLISTYLIAAGVIAFLLKRAKRT